MQPDMRKPKKPPLPTIRESLAGINESLRRIAISLEAGLFTGPNGDGALESIANALCDIAEYGPGNVPKDVYAWRHPIGKDDA